jgi:Apea-like HEPN
MPPIPVADRSTLLKAVVFEFYAKYARLLMESKARAQIQPFRFALLPWLTEKGDAEILPDDLKSRRAEMLNLGIDGASYVARLKEVLNSDSHLMECCGFVTPLIDHIDRHLGTMLLVDLMGTSRLDKAEQEWKDFVDLTYEGPLRRLSYTHLFNFKSEDQVVPLGVARIECVNRRNLADLLGESIEAVDFFHRPAESEYFLVFEESGWGPSPDDWLIEKQREANQIVLLMQLFKMGVLHTTYTFPFFSPSWVNSLWSRIVSPTYLGTFRGTPYKNGQAPYTLNRQEIENLRRWLRFYESPVCKAKLSGGTNGFGQMLLRSAEYYRSSLSRERAPERLVDLAIALESMFTPSSAHTELTFRIGQNLSQLVGKDAIDRIETSRLAKKLYDKRSALLHGQYDYAKFARGEFVSDDENEVWTDMIRTAIVRLAVLYFRGQTDREKFLAELSSAALDQTIGERIRVQSNPEAFLSQHY